MAPSDLPIVLYHYDQSPYAKRVIWYLTLRKIRYSQCIQPRIMPRPDVAALGVAYRRIPLVAIGRDVYLDTRLILRKLEQLFPPSDAHPALPGAGDPARTAIADLLSYRVTEGGLSGGLFGAAVQCFPSGMFNDPAFLRDRTELMGGNPDKPIPLDGGARRPEALAQVGRFALWLEDGLLGGGSSWISSCGGSGGGDDDGPGLADIEAVWVLHWLKSVPGALPADVLGAESTPRVWAWMERFAARAASAAAALGEPPTLAGDEAATAVAAAPYAEPEEGAGVAASDPVVRAEGLRKGVGVAVWPTDYGFTRRDRGTLVSVDAAESVIEAHGRFGSVRVHAPRHGFKVVKDDGGGGGGGSKI
ncbi:glutathione S-transferase [Xylariaceae sp. FL0804]|nr:glutathione S-transferase [Xylariaceae sp. FL0804]